MAPLISKIVSGIGFARSKGKILASGGSIKIFENYTYHVFTSPTIFNLTGAIDKIDYLIIVEPCFLNNLCPIFLLCNL